MNFVADYFVVVGITERTKDEKGISSLMVITGCSNPSDQKPRI